MRPVVFETPSDPNEPERKLIESIGTWRDRDGDVKSGFSTDELLWDLTIYWATGAMRLYR